MKKYIYTFCIIGFTLAACSSNKLITAAIPPINLPSNYQHSDTLTSSKLKRADFFEDPLLIQLMDTALVYNSDLQIAYQKVEMAKSGLLYYKGSLMPQVGIGVTASARKFGLYTMDGAGNATTDIVPNSKMPTNLPDYNIGIQSSWEVDFRGKLTNQKKAAANKLISSEQGVRYVQSNLIASVAFGYYELIALDNELDIIVETTKKQKEALEYVKAQKEAGKSNELAVLQFSAQLHNLNILEQEVRQQINREENTLNFLVGRFPQPIQRNKASLYRNVAVLHAGIPADLLTNRPDIKMVAYNLTAMQLDVKAAKAAFLPSFNIIGGVGFQAFNGVYLFRSPESIAYNVLGGLIAPLVNKSAIKASFKQAKSSEIEALAQYQQKVLNGYIEVVNELSEIKNLNSINILSISKNNENMNAVESALSLYKSARVPYLDVIISQQNALQSNLDLITIAKRKMLSTIKLYKSLGGGWE